MAEMKTLNGYEIVDAYAREQIASMQGGAESVVTITEPDLRTISINALASTYKDVHTLTYVYETTITSIDLLNTDLPQGLSIQFISNTGAAGMTNNATNVYFMGDDCKDGVFTPQKGQIYEIVLWPVIESTTRKLKAGVVNYGAY